MAQDQEESRHAPRVAHQFMVRYRLANTGQLAWQVSPLRDFSRTGVRFIAEHPYEIGAVLELQLALPTSREPLALAGRVAWAKPAFLGTAELGVTFDNIDSGSQQMIDDAIAHFLRTRPK